MSHSGIATARFAGTAAVEYSFNNTTWTAVSNAVVKIDDIELTRATGEAYVLGSSDWAVTTVGKREPVEITLTILYDTAVAASAFFNQFQASNPRCGIRWAPEGLVSNAVAFATSVDGGATTGLGHIVAFTFSSLDPSDANPYVVMITVRAPALRRYTLGTNPTNLS